MKTAEIIVATHKKYDMPTSKIYLPLQVGAKIAPENSGKGGEKIVPGKSGKDNVKNAPDLGYKKDSTGKNISEKNPTFCELTGLYWGWKNLKSDYWGLVHYRRHFTLETKPLITRKERMKSILPAAKLNKLINSKNGKENYDLILPKRRKYYIETLYSHYEHTLHVTPLNRTRDIIAERCPEYLAEFDRIQERRGAHMFNMMIGRREIMDKYCEWLFDILFALEKDIEEDEEFKPNYNKFHARFYGRISELLLDVWLYTNYPELKENLENDYIRVKELRIVEIDGLHFFKRAWYFLSAKFAGKKYNKSI